VGYKARAYYNTIMQYLPVPVMVWAVLCLQVSIYWWIAGLLIGFIFAVYGFSIGFHHTFSHPTFTFNQVVSRVLMYIGINSTLVAPITWAAAHFSHHIYVDTELDPHSPKYLGWKGMFFVNHKASNLSYLQSRRLFKDKFAVWAETNIGYWSVVLSYPILVAAIFGILGTIFLWIVPLFLSLLAGLVFTYAHGSDDIDGSQAKNSLLLWIISFGDGNHRLHHEKWDYIGYTHILCAKLVGGKLTSEIKK
jgi:stearoyl-CoA desaturase (Delta-9 desaturase)